MADPGQPFLALDTDVASLLQAGRLPADLQAHLVAKRLCITFVTVGEFYKGAHKRHWGAQRLAELERWMRGVIVLPYTAAVSRRWGELVAICEGRGQPIAPNDAWIAACCLAHSIPLMTRNRRHFVNVPGLMLIP